MSLWSEKSNSLKTGVLFQRQAPALAQLRETVQEAAKGKHQAAFVGLYVVLLLAYFRPHEVFPEVFGDAPLVKVATIVTIILYLFSKIRAGERIIQWPLEMKMLMVMWAMGLLFWPIALSSEDTFNVLFDPFIKTTILFVILIGLIDTRQRLRWILAILVVCQVLYAIGAIKTYMEGGYGEVASFNQRISGWGVTYRNPNDLASMLLMMLPLALCFGLTRRKLARPLYWAFAVLSVVGVILTFSRSNFIGLVIIAAFLVWKFSRGRRVRVLFAAAIVAAALMAALPGKYMVRLSTIVNPAADTTNSAQERQQILGRALELAVKRSIVGVGAGNFHIFSVKERLAHNSFLETAAELGIVGLIAYLVLIIAPFRSLGRIERETRKDGPQPDWEAYVISLCLQASILAYVVYGFFGSVQYQNSLYFIVAYVISFRQILAAEREQSEAQAKADAETALTRGVLWQPQHEPRLQLTGGHR